MMLFVCFVGMIGKKEEELRGESVGVSLGFLIGWFRRTQYITSIGLNYKEVGILLGGCLTVKN